MKTIIEMAGKAFETLGVEPAFRNGFWTVTSEELERFAALVRADEREACAKVCDDAVGGKPTDDIHSDGQWAALTLAAAIRARGQA
jgi:hypothetical protein